MRILSLKSLLFPATGGLIFTIIGTVMLLTNGDTDGNVKNMSRLASVCSYFVAGLFFTVTFLLFRKEG